MASRRLRLAHLTTVDMSLALLLGTELAADVAAGHEVFGISAPGPYVADVERLGVTHVPVPSFTRSWSIRDDVRAATELNRALRSLDLDVLHTHTPKAGVLGRCLGRLAGVPVVVNTCHGLWVGADDPGHKRALVLGAEAVAGWFSDAELYQNDEDRRALSRFLPRGRGRTVGNGVDLEKFRPDPTARARVRAELGVGNDQILVGGVGRLVAEKGVADFAAVAHDLADLAVFVWVGPTDDDKADAVATAEGDVRFLGLRHDMPALYAAFDIFALPSRREGFSRSAMEAAACGCALVLSDIRGCRELGRNEAELLLCPPGDVAALHHAISRLITDAALRTRLAEAAQERAAVAFDQRAIAQSSLDTYEAVARRKKLA